MNVITQYFKELKSYFEEEDLQDYQEIKEVLKEYIDASLEEGRTIEDIIASMAPPEEIASDFFEDRRIETALNAKKDVVASEEIPAVFLQKLKRRAKLVLRSILYVTYAFFSAFLLCLLFYFLIYLVKEILNEHHLALIPLTSVFVILAVFLFSLTLSSIPQHKKNLRFSSFFLFAMGLSVFLFGIATNTLFYKGEEINKTIAISHTSNVQLSIDSDAKVEVAVIEVPENEHFRIMLDGHFRKSDMTNLAQAIDKNKVTLELDQSNHWNQFTHTGHSDILIFIPKDLVLDELSVHLANGKLQIIDLNAKDLNLNMTNGDFYGKNIVADSGTIHNKYGDIVMEQSKFKLALTSLKGKTIIDYFNGAIVADVHESLIIIKHSIAPSLILESKKGKVIVEDSIVKKIQSTTDSGQHVIKSTVGDIDIQSNSGKIILQNNFGALAVKNTSGNTISIQKDVLDSSIESESGFIKWVQQENSLLNVVTTTEKGKLLNLVGTTQETDTTVKIHSTLGDIRVVKSE